MQNIHDIIEIKRGLHKICGRDLVNIIAELNNCEEFYRNVFQIYGVVYNTETLSQKENFINAVTIYFILDRLSEGSLSFEEGKYIANNKKEIKKLLENVLNDFFVLLKTFDSNEDFKKKYAEHFNEDVKDFSKEISENRDDSLSDFAKLIQNVYKNSKDKNRDC